MYGSPKTCQGAKSRIFKAVSTGWVLGLLAWLPSGLVLAAPAVSFDVAAVVECRDVTPEEFAAIYPLEKLVEARFQISALVAVGAQEELAELFYRVESPQRSLVVADYLPRTTLTSEYASNLGFEEKSERATTFGLNAAGTYGPLSTANGMLSIADKSANCLRYELLPPMETVAASGTVDRGRGVYYKLRATAQNAIEGSQEVVVVFRVPRVWRADYVALTCQAYSETKAYPFSSVTKELCGQGRFLVALYQRGDEGARRAATDFIRAESTVRRAAVTHRADVEKRAVPTPVHELAVQFAGKSPRIPPTWLDQLLLGTDQQAGRFMGYLPAPVREAALDYTLTRRKLRAVNRQPARLPDAETTAKAEPELASGPVACGKL